MTELLAQLHTLALSTDDPAVVVLIIIVLVLGLLVLLKLLLNR